MEMLDAIRSWANEKGYLHEDASEGPSALDVNNIHNMNSSNNTNNNNNNKNNQLRPLSLIEEPLPSGRSTPKKVASGGTFGSENEEKLKMVGEDDRD